MSTIRVHNRTGSTIHVAISLWGEESASPDFFPIPGQGEDSWNRTDDRGYVMVVRQRANSSPYYVVEGATYNVEQRVVKRGDVIIEPIKD